MKRGRILGIAMVAVLVAGGVTGLILARWHLFAKRFAVVEAGAVYRGGEQQRGPYERILDDNKIRTIVNLNFPSSDPSWDALEYDLADARHIERVGFSMPGDGVAGFDDLEKAAAILADPAKQPVFVHCSAGVNRTNAVCAVYRLKYCGWSVDDVLAEADRRWLDRKDNPELVEHIRAYAERLQAQSEHTPSSRDSAATAPVDPS